MTMLVILALFGAFGDGPLSNLTVTTADGWTLEIARVMRAENPERIRLHGMTATDTTVAVVDSSTLRWLTIETAVPDPVTEVRSVTAMEFTLATPRGAGAHLELVVVPHTIGWHRFRARVGTARWTDIRILVLP